MGTSYDEHNETPSLPGMTPVFVEKHGAKSQYSHTQRREWGTRNLFIAALIMALIFCVGLTAGWQFGFQSALNSSVLLGRELPSIERAIETQREDLIASVRPAVVQINVKGKTSNSNGSGVIIDKRGYIVTNAHVIAGEQTIEVVLYNGQMLTASLVGTAAADDLAVIKINPQQTVLHTVRLGDSSSLQVGQMVMAIGNPLGINQTVTSGIVSALGRNVATGKNGQILPSTIQTDAAINPGNSGGALVDMSGAVIGIPTLTAIDPEYKTPANGVGFAIPSNRVSFIVPQLIASGRVMHTGRAALEAQVVDVDPIIAAQEHLAATQGALIVSVISGGAASRAGLKRGDIIVTVDNRPVSNVLSLSDTLLDKDLGDVVAVQFYRGNQLQTVQVKLGELPAL
jgi:Trypsin-like serine proteases, typically periplasmic, contain C-terminal PDZ domain